VLTREESKQCLCELTTSKQQVKRKPKLVLESASRLENRVVKKRLVEIAKAVCEISEEEGERGECQKMVGQGQEPKKKQELGMEVDGRCEKSTAPIPSNHNHGVKKASSPSWETDSSHGLKYSPHGHPFTNNPRTQLVR